MSVFKSVMGLNDIEMNKTKVQEEPEKDIQLQIQGNILMQDQRKQGA